MKRIMKDIRRVEEAKHPGVFIDYEESNMTQINALIIGPRDTIYAGGFFYFRLDLTEFPLNPPKATFLSPPDGSFRIHPNLYGCGKVCLSMLNTWSKPTWSPLLTIEKVLITIQSLLDDEPIRHEPGFEKTAKNSPKSKAYSLMARYLNMKNIPFMLSRNDISPNLKNIMKHYILENQEIYKRSIEIINEESGQNVQSFHVKYRIKCMSFDDIINEI